MNTDRDFVDRVRSATDIVKTVGDYLHLRKVGRRHTGLCPFHAEKTPSFSVDEQKQLFYCFGCGAGGDVFKFLMLHEKLEFGEALKTLAEKHGIELPVPSRRGRGIPLPRGLKDRLHEAHTLAAAHYREALAHNEQGRPGREYLATRGIKRATIERLGLGYAPQGWENLKSRLLARGFLPEEMATSGLVVPRSDGSGSYDRFRERIVFPIVSVSGRIVGFGGRAVASSSDSRMEPKYLNSPETPIYSKSETLYGLYQAREALRARGFAVLVEGYLDFASLFEAGIENVVASLGTAFTDGHARLLARYVDRVVVNYDADAAGKAAALRSLAPLVARGLQVKVLRLPAGEDPDLYVRRIGPDEYRKQLESAPDAMDYTIEEAVSGQDLRSPKSQVQALNRILPLLAAFDSPIERGHYVAILADRLRIEDSLVLAAISKAVKDRKTSVAPPPPRDAQSRVSVAEKGLLRALIEDATAREELVPRIDLDRVGDIRTLPILSEILQRAARGEEIGYGALSGRFVGEDDEIPGVLGSIAMQTDAVEDLLVYGRDCIETLERNHLEAECRRIQRRIDATSDLSMHQQLTERKFEISIEISKRTRDLS